MSKVRVVINKKTQERRIEVNGVLGDACEDITRAIEQANEVVEKQYTSEYENPEYLPEYIEEGE